MLRVPGLTMLVVYFARGAKLHGQTTEGPEREEAYHRLLEFSSLVHGGRITSRWMQGGTVFGTRATSRVINTYRKLTVKEASVC